MLTKKISFYWIIISFFIGTLFGTGAIWQYKHLEIQRENTELVKIKESVTLREKITEELLKINKLNNEYFELLEGKKINSKRFADIATHFAVLEDNINSYESKLAKLENRQHRKFTYPRPFSPSPPKLRIE